MEPPSRAHLSRAGEAPTASSGGGVKKNASYGERGAASAARRVTAKRRIFLEAAEHGAMIAKPSEPLVKADAEAEAEAEAEAKAKANAEAKAKAEAEAK